MREWTTDELRKLAHDKFGRDLTDTEIKSVASRLPALAQTADLISVWQSRLGETAPATSFSVSKEDRGER